MAQIKPITLPAVAVDVGFFSTKFTLGRNKEDNHILVDQFPSVTQPVRANLQRFTAAGEHDGALFETEPGVHHYVGKDVLNYVNSSGTRAVISNFSESSAYKALFLGALFYMARHHKAEAGLVINKMVVGLPMTTIYSHNESLKTLVQGEHTIPHPSLPGSSLNVTIKSVLVVAQPQGALINHGVSTYGKPADSTSLVLDMGGGTFDWFVSKGLIPNHERCGATPIGALACASAVCDQIHPELKDDPEIMSRVDTALRTGAESVRITGREYQMADYWPAVKAVLNDALEQMLKKAGSLRNIDSILLTGGGSKMLAKIIPDALNEFHHLVVIDQEPVYSNVRGFHVISEMQAGS